MKLRKSSIQSIPFRNLTLDPRAQRAVVGPQLKRLVKNFDLDKVGILTVSVRDGIPYVVDGQHRWRAAVEKGLGDTKVKCEVFRDLSLEQEAALFLSRNDAALVSAIDKFRVGLTKKDQDCLGVKAILDDYGCEVGTKAAYGCVSCPDTVLRIYRGDNGVLLREVLDTVTNSWGTGGDALEHTVLKGTSQVLSRYNGEIDRAQLVKKLAKYPGGASGLIGNARGLSRMKPGLSVTKAAAESILDTYNKGRRSGALPPL